VLLQTEFFPKNGLTENNENKHLARVSRKYEHICRAGFIIRRYVSPTVVCVFSLLPDVIEPETLSNASALRSVFGRPTGKGFRSAGIGIKGREVLK
jgi:hypothetical protein